MRYTKPALSFADQAERLIQRGLVADRDELAARLAAVNYYRLSAYWYTFRIPGDPDDRLIPGTTLVTVWRRYVFDRQLRLLVMDAIERVEVAVRSQIVNRHAIAHGALGYLDRATLPGISVEDHRRLLEKVRVEAKKSQEDFVRHYLGKYTLEHDLPLWMACELMTFGSLLTLFMGLKTRMKKDVAQYYGLTVPVLGSWLRTLTQVRNICAHHARLWNRILGVRAVLPEADGSPEWHTPVQISGDTAFGVLTILHHMLRQVAPSSSWLDRLLGLFALYTDVPLRFMGFPDNWMDSPLWQAPTRTKAAP